MSLEAEFHKRLEKLVNKKTQGYIMAAFREAQAVVAKPYTEGHCTEKAKPGGCQLHNLHCGYPDCDRRPL